MDPAKIAKLVVNPAEMETCLEESKAGRDQSLFNRVNAEQQNFTIHPPKLQENSTTKYIGTHGNKMIENVIDQDDLKRSHLPL